MQASPLDSPFLQPGPSAILAGNHGHLSPNSSGRQAGQWQEPWGAGWQKGSRIWTVNLMALSSHTSFRNTFSKLQILKAKAFVTWQRLRPHLAASQDALQVSEAPLRVLESWTLARWHSGSARAGKEHQNARGWPTPLNGGASSLSLSPCPSVCV